ncbi:murein transglycosylase A [Pseudothauera rhizosphaerae]|uniref:peptidoglycan lytic exotransglycosylase n=1 Tax=Pseudothauera rhizosphaerae TaxID=2565932 RepID=A0A4S4APT7_9RHOO|nr:MltA domain-containing protein [Pseudothauera rhizosphaerae]THF61268.1 murein transglycosylase [Pseudothauera rhizosphaerae]
MTPPNLRARRLLAGALFLAAALGGCATPPPAPTAEPAACPKPAPCPACPVCPAVEAPVPPPPAAEPLQAADWSALAGWQDDDHAAAWPALLASCAALGARAEWQAVCAAASAQGDRVSPAGARQFFEAHFVPWAVVNPDGSREGLVTGYYEPLIKGSRNRDERYRWPVHGVPADMLAIDLGGQYPELKNMRLRGRLDGNRVVPYFSRGELEQRGDALPAPVLLWAEDAIDLFFLHVQGSGRVELPDGSRVRIGYADQNGHPYASIGRWLIDQGELTRDRASMQGIKDWARRNPLRLSELLNANPSYVFFRELTQADGGPIGALGVPLTDERSVAVDPRTVPLGAPVFLSTTWPLSDRPLERLMLAQDTGSAIKGAVRADFFWGFGPDAGARAGRMRQQGRMWVLLPRGMQPPRP